MKSVFFSLCFLLAFASLSRSQEPGDTAVDVTITAQTPDKKEAQPGRSEGFVLKELSFDPSAGIPDAKSKTGAVFESFKPGTVWHGQRPGFVPEEVALGGEDRISCTDVYEEGPFLYAHYGPDHYRTRMVVIVDANRHERYRLTAYELPNLARVHLDEESGILYYTKEAANTGEKANASLHAFSLKDSRELWKSEAGTAHGNFIVYEDHIVSHYGFTGEDDFICVIDKGSGETLKKHKIKTAASHLIKEGGKILAPCYEGLVEMTFEEK